jgi:hypothetical protein
MASAPVALALPINKGEIPAVAEYVAFCEKHQAHIVIHKINIHIVASPTGSCGCSLIAQ